MKMAKCRHAIFSLALSTLVLVLCACSAYSGSNETSVPGSEVGYQGNEEAAGIYAAILQHLIMDDIAQTGQSQTTHLYILRQTYDSVGNPDAPWADSHEIDIATQKETNALLSAFPIDIVWINSTIDVSPEIYDAHQAIVTLGNLHYNRDRDAIVSASLYLPAQGVTGKTLILSKITEGNHWQVDGNTGVKQFGKLAP
jgi:hypothetical protein